MTELAPQDANLPCPTCGGSGSVEEPNPFFDPDEDDSAEDEFHQVACRHCHGEANLTAQPCPHCGSIDVFVERADLSSAYVFCNGCSSRGPEAGQDSDDEETPGGFAAIKAWNTRTPSPDAGEPVALPSYGSLPWDQLGKDVREAQAGHRDPFDFGDRYPGHCMTDINFNSLSRIIDKYRLPASVPPAGEVTEPANLLSEIKRMREVVEAARYLPREVPGPGGTSTRHEFSIEAGVIWSLDKALRALDALSTLSPQEPDNG